MPRKNSTKFWLAEFDWDFIEQFNKGLCLNGKRDFKRFTPYYLEAKGK
jgi:hypothetical protein